MDGQFFIDRIGKPIETPEVSAMLAQVGVTEQLRMPQDDIDARADLPGQGLSLIFKPEAPRSSRLVFYAVQFFSDVEPDHARFAGALPGGISFDDDQGRVHGKLGAPVSSKPNLRRDFWDMGSLRLSVKYAKTEPNRVAVVAVQLPLES